MSARAESGPALYTASCALVTGPLLLPRRTRALASLPHVPPVSRMICAVLCAAASGRRGAVGGVVSMVVRGEPFICSPTEITALILAIHPLLPATSLARRHARG